MGGRSTQWIRDRHRDAFLTLAEHVAPHLYEPAPAAWLEALDLEAANLALASERAAETDGGRALRLCLALTVWWKFRGRFELADATFRRALDAPGADAFPLRARAIWVHAYLLVYAGRFDEALGTAATALELAERLEDDITAARALTAVGTVLMLRDPLAAQPELERARQLAREAGDDWCLGESTEILATTFIMQADPAGVRLLEDAYEVYERSGYAEFVAWYWWDLGTTHQAAGRDEQAFAAYERAVAAADSVGEPVSGGTAQGFRATLRAERGEGTLALAELQPAMERAVATGAGFAMPALLAATFYAQASIGQLEQARDSLRWYVETNIGGGPYANGLVLTYLARGSHRWGSWRAPPSTRGAPCR
jgi:tetratricopeptide (TPR) repeat protein